MSGLEGLLGLDPEISQWHWLDQNGRSFGLFTKSLFPTSSLSGQNPGQEHSFIVTAVFYLCCQLPKSSDSSRAEGLFSVRMIAAERWRGITSAHCCCRGPDFIPRTHIRWRTATGESNSRGLTLFSGLGGHCSHLCIPMHRNPYNHK